MDVSHQQNKPQSTSQLESKYYNTEYDAKLKQCF